MILLFFLVACMSSVIHAEEPDEKMITVKLKNYLKDTDELQLQIKGSYQTLSPTFSLKEGVNYTLFVKKGKLYISDAKEFFKLHGDFILIPSAIDEEHLIYINDRPYMGAMTFTVEDKHHIRPYNQLPLEDYLKGVVPNEVFPSWHLNALKAQTLAARTYAYIHSNSKAEMDDTIRFQVYGGYTPYENTNKAVEETEGEIITYRNKPINAFYSASNGGITESNTNVWGGQDKPYFPIKEDPYDPEQPWKIELNKVQISKSQLIYGAPFHWLTVTEKNDDIANSIRQYLTNQGYISAQIVSIDEFEINKEQTEGKRKVTGSIAVTFIHRSFGDMIFFDQISLKDEPLKKIRPMIGGTQFKSYLIESVQEEKDRYIIKGKGYGHGVGMSQWGASEMANAGKDYKEIIAFYYPSTEITKIY